MIRIIYIADSSKHFDEAIKEYLKRLNKVELVKIKPTKLWNKSQIIQKDTENINKRLEKFSEDFNVLLSLNWKQLDTLSFTSLIKKRLDQGININFIIGWAFGLDEDILNYISYKLQLSKLTFPHSLALLVLLEQIYRSFQIINWRNYHY